MAIYIDFPPDSPSYKFWNRLILGTAVFVVLAMGVIGWAKQKYGPQPKKEPEPVYKQAPDSGGKPIQTTHSGRY